MEDVTYYLKMSANFPRSNPKAIMRRYVAGGATRSEAYRFNGQGWTATDFFDLYRLGHTDDDYIEVSQEEAESAIAAKIRRKAELDGSAER